MPNHEYVQWRELIARNSAHCEWPHFHRPVREAVNSTSQKDGPGSICITVLTLGCRPDTLLKSCERAENTKVVLKLRNRYDRWTFPAINQESIGECCRIRRWSLLITMMMVVVGVIVIVSLLG